MTKLNDVFKTYMNFRYGSESSIKNDFNRYSNHLQPFFNDISLSNITTLKVYEFRKHLENKKLSRQTIHHCLALLRATLNKSVAFGYMSVENFPQFDMPHIDNSRIRFLSQEEAARLLNLLKTKSTLCYEISYFALQTGLRAGEIFNLKKENFDKNNKIINVLDTKTFKSRYIPVQGKCYSLIEGRSSSISNGQFIFYSRNPNKKINEISKTYFRTVQQLGFNNGIKDRRETVCFHTLRHTFASWLIQSGVSTEVLASLLGHTTTKMTMRYAHLANKQFQDAINYLPDLL